MKKLLLVILVPLSLGGCLSYTETPAPKTTTVVVPSGAPVVCANGQPGPC